MYDEPWNLGNDLNKFIELKSMIKYIYYHKKVTNIYLLFYLFQPNVRKIFVTKYWENNYCSKNSGTAVDHATNYCVSEAVIMYRIIRAESD